MLPLQIIWYKIIVCRMYYIYKNHLFDLYTCWYLYFLQYHTNHTDYWYTTIVMDLKFLQIIQLQPWIVGGFSYHRMCSQNILNLCAHSCLPWGRFLYYVLLTCAYFKCHFNTSVVLYVLCQTSCIVHNWSGLYINTLLKPNDLIANIIKYYEIIYLFIVM